MRENTRVLLVDDTAEIRELFGRYLHRLGYTQVQQAEDGRRALELTASYNPNVILMDTQMPGPYGPEVCAQIRQTEHSKRIGIIGMSDSENPIYRDVWMEAGADDFLKKADIFASSQALDEAIQRILIKYGG